MKNLLTIAAQLSMDSFLSSAPGSLKERCARFIRRILNRIGDPVIRIPVQQGSIWAHLSHNLPVYRKHHVLYDSALRRFAEFTSHESLPLGVIDVGANIGDTAAMLMDIPEIKVLCVEGGIEFFDLLDRNAALHPGRVTVERSFLGRANSLVSGAMQSQEGTARFEKLDGAGTMKVETLTALLERQRAFLDARILKIDTDGYDCEILRGAISWLAHAKPVIFMEFFPELLQNVSDDYQDVFRALHEIGYDLTLAYKNTGEYFFSGHVGAVEFIPDLDYLTRMEFGPCYFDLFLFHADDLELGRSFRSSELSVHS